MQRRRYTSTDELPNRSHRRLGLEPDTTGLFFPESKAECPRDAHRPGRRSDAVSPVGGERAVQIRQTVERKAGQTIGFVGDTGSSTTAHPYFEVHGNGGDPINSYPIVKSVGACNRGTLTARPAVTNQLTEIVVEEVGHFGQDAVEWGG